MKPIVKIAAVILSLLAFHSPVSAQSLNADSVLAKMEEANKDYPYFQATMRETIYKSVINVLGDPKSGKLWISRTGSMPRQIRIEYDKPMKEIVVVEQGVITHYFPNSKSGDKVTFNKEEQPEKECVFLGLCQSSAVIKQYYNANVLRQEVVGGVKTTLLELKPKDPKRLGQFTAINLWLDSSKWFPVQTRVFESNGNYKNYEYTGINTKNFSNSVYKLDIPKDASIETRKWSQ